jgi:hypothetical protein
MVAHLIVIMHTTETTSLFKNNQNQFHINHQVISLVQKNQSINYHLKFISIKIYKIERTKKKVLIYIEFEIVVKSDNKI